MASKTRGIGYKPFSPSPNHLCLCGSGLKFSECCASRIPGARQVAEWSDTFLEKDDLKEALYAARAETTKYTTLYKSHTEPAIRAGMPKNGSLFDLDIRAMSELVATLMSRYVGAGLMHEFPIVLERLRANIPEPEWQRKIIYFHSLHSLWPDDDRDAGRREFKKLGSVADDRDAEILQLRLDLFCDELSFSQRLDLIDRILAQKLTLADRLQYRGAKAVQFIGIGDNQKADEELTAAVDEARAQEEKLSISQRHKLAQLLSLLGSLRRDVGLMSESLTLHNELLEADYWTPRGKAILLGDIAELHKHKGEWEEARDGYLRALQIQILPIHNVFLSECLLQLERHEEASATLAEVNIDNLSNNERIDYAFVTAGLAIEVGTREGLEAARVMLKELHIAEPLFRERRDSILLNVQEAISSGSSKPLMIRTKRLLASMLRSATTYLILRPSFMGVGLDIGKLVENHLPKSDQPPQPPIDKRKSVSLPVTSNKIK
jgi:tetratricopeptide (TPR) repeat protein